MWRQFLDALRDIIADFFEVPWQTVAAMLAVIALLIVMIYVRTTTMLLQTGGVRMLLSFGILLALAVAGNTLRRR